MKKSLKIFLIVLIVLEVLQLILQVGAIAGLDTLFGITDPFDSLPTGERYTFSVTNTGYKTDLTEEDAGKFRDLLSNCTLPLRTPLRIAAANRAQTLTIHMTDGETHSISFLSDEEILGREFGLVEYDGQEYAVDSWLYRYGIRLCAPYYEEYREWDRRNRE